MGKVIIVTGASSGIGLTVAKHLADEGHHVYGISRSKIHEKNVRSIQADVTNIDQMIDAYQEIYDIEGRIDVLINNAGIGISGSIEDTLSEDVLDLFHVNFMGVFHSTKVALPFMREGKQGKIINISSVASVLSIPFQSFYSSSKAAINAFSNALANEVEPFGIDVCVVMPGDIKTSFTKNRRKNEIMNPHYEKRIDKSVAVMEKDEQNGMDPEVLAKVIHKLIKKKRMPLYKTIGFKYKIFVFLEKILPAGFTNAVVGKIYGFKKGKK
ncbi:MAG: SDR family oxidoreductase [Acholeplasmataceae bacterium]|jgi:short-subunit dehydrogenase|nr:SDR family oxidoreductase [Acholeplasmataceae bacterium]MDD4193731.1 SDR family oxidoreductase [Acholeplasmataceae bacterium]